MRRVLQVLLSAALRPEHPPRHSAIDHLTATCFAGTRPTTRHPLLNDRRCVTTVPAGPHLPTQPVNQAGTSSSAAAFTEVPALDIFAQSRISNYVSRVATHGAPLTPTAKFDAFATMRLERVSSQGQEPSVRATLTVPVDVMEDAHVVRQDVCAVGFGPDDKSARVACCMHAERCLDALGIPLFTSARRQREHAAQAQSEGRLAPSYVDGTERKELRDVALPPPVRATGTAADSASGSGAPRMPPQSLYSAVKISSYQPNYPPTGERSVRRHGVGGVNRPHRRRHEQHRLRYGPDPFLSQVAEELAQLQHVMLQRASVEDDDDEGEGEGGNRDVDSPHTPPPMGIEAHEVSILQPSDADATDPPARSLARVAAPNALAHMSPGRGIGYQHPERMQGMRGRHSAALVDESEGGVFDLAEGDGESWWWAAKEPGPWCIRDPHAAGRVNAYCQETRHAAFADCVALHTSTEPTSFLDRQRRCFDVKDVTWYTAVFALPEVVAAAAPAKSPSAAGTANGPLAIGKATSAEKAMDLCAMHAEALLGYAGVPIYGSDGRQQARYFAAGLGWGRCFSPVPRPVHAAADRTAPAAAALPKPLKEWHLNTKIRFRSCPLNTAEKLLALNRRLVGQARLHLLELDFTTDDFYAEVVALAEPCVRQFMVSKSHPFEAAYFTFIYQKGSQYRSSIYLPLPERYGVRGGYAIAPTPTRARQLAALHAIDVLCALSLVPESCLRQADWQRMLLLRKAKGFIVPSSSTANEHMRSPPGYREVRRGASRRLPSAQDVWRVMMLDADVFDVTPPLFSSSHSASRRRGGPTRASEKLVDWHGALTELFHTCMRYLAGWGPEEVWCHVHHYCGAQHVRGHRRLAANSYWLLLPLDAQRYGQRMAVGRCVSRVGALRQLYIHALRILHTLHATPWDALPTHELLLTVHRGNRSEMASQLTMWGIVKDQLLVDVVETDGQGERDALRSSVSEAEIVASEITATDAPPAWDQRGVLSPHPAMSFELASRTFV